MSSRKYFISDTPQKRKLYSIIDTIKNEVEAIKYRIIFSGINVDVKDKKYNVSVCGIFKNEAAYLKEWIEFNHIVGIEHFYLYNNNSDDNYLGILQPYIDAGLVTLVDWPHNQMQMEAYKDCISSYSKETKWIGFIDIDEFIVPKSTDNVYEFLRKFEKKRGSVNIYWKLFGTSGRLTRNVDNLVTEDFTVCWPKYCDIGKCFYNTQFEFNFKSEKSSQLHHKFWANWKGKDIPPVNIFDKICVGNRNVVKDGCFPIQINHYFTKSYDEYAAKRAKGDVYFEINPHDEAYFYEHEMKCTDVDYSAYKYLIRLKMQMQKNDNL